MSRQVKRFGYIPDLGDHRDHLFTDVRGPDQVPRSFDLWPDMPECYDQGQLGSCTGNGWARVMEKMEKTDGRVSGTPSRLFIYYYERVLNGTVDQDSGAQIRDGAKVVSTQGVPPETDWAYDINRFAEEPPSGAVDDAQKEKALEYLRIQIGGPGAPMRSAVSQGYPIVFGFPVPDYFEDPSVWDPATQALPVPGANVNWIGGHCVTVTGYDFTEKVYPVPVFICDNSWGPGWGKGGRFAMDFRWFTRDNSPNPLASDLWIVKKVS